MKLSTPAEYQKWWKEAVIYQIYPRSFRDSNGDGIGDIRGIIEKLDYIKSLGIDVIWLNPIFSSPNDDNGYDISDYYNIMDDFGSMDDFDELLAGLHERGLRLILDLVVNHSSDEHEWFVNARSCRSNRYREYYHWWPAENGLPPERFSIFDVDRNAWMYEEQTNSWYLHYFSRKQPDLNWENPALRKEIYDMMRFWLDKGIDGFRMDVISFISKDTSFPDLRFSTEHEYLVYYANGPHLHEYLQEMNEQVLGKYDIMTVAEGAGVSKDQALKFVDPDRAELNMLYHFEGTDIKDLPSGIGFQDPKYDLINFKTIYSEWDHLFAEKGWGTIYLGNHDQPRMVSRWGNDAGEYRALSSKMLSTFLLTMRATPYYYAGDELGMANIRFGSINEYDDIATINRYKKLESEGGDLAGFLEEMKAFSRDNGRTPFQWDASPNAGFSSGTPWLKVNSDYSVVNAEVQDKDPASVLNYFRKLIRLRKQFKTLVYGSYALIDKDNPFVYAYIREWKGEKILIVLNFSRGEHSFNPELRTEQKQLLLCNYSCNPTTSTLRAYEAQIIRLS